MGFFDKIKNVIKKIGAPAKGSIVLLRNNYWNEQWLKAQIKKEKNFITNTQIRMGATPQIEKSKNQLKSKTMTMFNYGVGGNEIQVDANEAIQEIQGNKTLIVGQLTTDEPVNPEIVSGLKTVEEVFKYFSPSIAVEHETEEGVSVKEDFKFKNVGDFSPKNIVENSEFLKNLKLSEEQYNKIIRQLRVNKVLRNLLTDDQSRLELVEMLKLVAKELEK